MAETARPTRPILSVQVSQETDFLMARQRAKQLAQVLGFELQDQTRIATAVSEIARNAFEYAGGGRVEFHLDLESSGRHGTGHAMRIEVIDFGPGIAQIDGIFGGTYESRTGMGLGLTGARRLMDALHVSTAPGGTQVTLIKRLPRLAEPPSIQAITAHLASTPVAGAAAQTRALQEQNHELLATLAELRAREAELETLNAELEETNRGVLVLYAELEDKAQAVQRASEIKTRFLSGVTHELRTPLNSIVSLSRLMLSHTDGPLDAEQEKQVQFILRSAQNLTDMVNDLLDLAKLEAGRTENNLTQFLVGDLFGGLRGMFRPLATNPNVKLLFEIPEQTILLHSDEGKVAQILRNLISNALKFTEQGTVTVTATPLSETTIRFTVTDTGVGIKPEHFDLVMQEWGQVEGTQPSRGKARGSGLGLPLSRGLAEMLGGQLHFTSQPGVGSTFNLTLPALMLPRVEAHAPVSPEQPYLLMIDDDEVARYLLRRSLGKLTTSPIEEASSAADGLAAIAARKPCVAFVDSIMPGIDGLELIRRLRSRDDTRTLPVVLYTAKSLTPEERRAVEAMEVTIISKGAGTADEHESEERMAQLERVLLEVGLNNRHQQDEPAANGQVGNA